MYLLLAALDGETRAFREELKNPADESWRGFPVLRGMFGELPAVVSRTGAGKVLTALLTQHLIDRYQPRGIIFTGTAGALNPEYRLGDLVIARDCLQYDMDVTPLGFLRGEIPHTGYRLFPSDPDLLAAASGYVPREGNVHRGRILTGDSYIAGEESRGLLTGLEGDAVEMEGAAAALTALVNGIPFLLARVISDRADGKTSGSFGSIMRRASGANLEFLRYLLPRAAGIQRPGID